MLKFHQLACFVRGASSPFVVCVGSSSHYSSSNITGKEILNLQRALLTNQMDSLGLLLMTISKAQLLVLHLLISAS